MKSKYLVLLLFLGCFCSTSSIAVPSSVEMAPDTLLVAQDLDSTRKVIYTVIIDTLAIDTVDIYKNRLPAGYSYTADVLVDYAKQYIGTPYRYSARGPSAFDCSGFTRYIFNKFDYKLENSSRNQYRSSKWSKVERDSLMIGDLVFFGGRSASSSVGHVGIVSSIDDDGDFSFIHASTSLGVCETEFSTSPYYIRRYLGARRILPEYDTMFVEGAEVEQLTVRVERLEHHELAEEQKNILIAASSQTPAQQEALQTMLDAADEETLQATPVVYTEEVPVEDKATRESENEEEEYYSVVRGDSPYGIARKHGISLSRLCELNNISNVNSLKIYPGDRLRVK